VLHHYYRPLRAALLGLSEWGSIFWGNSFDFFCVVGVLPLKMNVFSMLAYCFGVVNTWPMLYFLLILWTN
jgi:hypothetical protein